MLNHPTWASYVREKEGNVHSRHYFYPLRKNPLNVRNSEREGKILKRSLQSIDELKTLLAVLSLSSPLHWLIQKVSNTVEETDPQKQFINFNFRHGKFVVTDIHVEKCWWMSSIIKFGQRYVNVWSFRLSSKYFVSKPSFQPNIQTRL